MFKKRLSLKNEVLSVLYDEEIVISLKVPYGLTLESSDIFLPTELGYGEKYSVETINKVFTPDGNVQLLELLKRVRDGRCSVLENLQVKDVNGKSFRSTWIITKVQSEFKTECYIHAVGIVIGGNPKTDLLLKFFKTRFGSILVNELTKIKTNFEILKLLTDCYGRDSKEIEIFSYSQLGRGYQLSNKSYFLEKFEEEIDETISGESSADVHAFAVNDIVADVIDEGDEYPTFYTEFITGKSQQPFYQRIDGRGELVVPIFLNKKPYCLIHISYLDEISDSDISIVISSIEKVRILLELNEAISELKNDAITDRVTNTWTRQYFMKRILVEEANLKRYGGAGTIAVIDISDFRFINERYGHKVADRILNQVAIVIKDSVRCVDFVARYDGDIFIAFFPRAEYEDSLVIMKRIMTHIDSHDFSELNHKLYIDYGQAQYGLDGEKMNDLIHKAENRMATSKRKRKIAQLEDN